MALSPNGLQRLLTTNVVELKFIRRHPKVGNSDSRRMFVTNCAPFLLSIAGRVTLKYQPPTQPPAYDYKAKGLMVGFDLMSLDYRMIACESVNVVSAVPIDTKEKQDKFWEWFVVSQMAFWTSEEKKKFIDS